MDTLTFIATLVNALAWPLLAMFVFLAVRKPLIELLPQVRKLRYRTIEAEFGQEMAQIEEKMASEMPTSMQPAPMPENEESRLISLAEIAPKAAVLEAWKAIEIAAKRLIERRGHTLDYAVDRPYYLIERVLESSGILEPAKIRIFRDLRQLRNKVAHADEFMISNRQAVEYTRVAMTLRRYLDELRETSPR